jgi:hypothetical protein
MERIMTSERLYGGAIPIHALRDDRAGAGQLHSEAEFAAP